MNWLSKVMYFFCCVVPVGLSAQNEVDALRYSYTDSPVSARSAGMGGAFGALGADLSSFWNNPAGIGAYKRGGIEFTLGFHEVATEAGYSGNSASNNKSNLTIQNIASIGSRTTQDPSFKILNFGIAYGKINNFNQNISIRGQDVNSSLTQVFAAQANGTSSADLTNFFPFSAGLAWDTYLIDPLDTVSHSYIPVVSGSNVNQSKVIERTGAMAETVFGGGASYRDFIFFGASIGIQGIRFKESNTYSESFDQTEDLERFTYGESLNTTGTGINIKFGILARLTPWLRVGGAYQSRTSIALTDVYSSTITSNFRNGETYTQSSPDNNYSYGLKTPSRWMGNIAFMMGDYGVIAADYEYSNYSSIKLKSTAINDSYDFSSENSTIKNIYKGTHKARVGAEVRISNYWRARAGASYFQSAFVNGTALNTPQVSLSTGGGYRHDNFLIDFALVYRASKESYYLYDPRLVNPTSIAYSRVSFMVGVGLRF